MAPIIQIRGLLYSYRRQKDRPALLGVDLDVSEGEFIAIAGRAGSGKSTLCYALNGLIPHSFGGHMEGEVIVCGLNTRTTSVPDLARHVGFVLQNAESQLVGLSVEEDTAFGLENIALPPHEINSRVNAALQTVRLQDHGRSSPWTLSGGQKQRLAIAAALAFQPQVLVLDNPTAELDPVGKQEVMATIAQLNRERGVTVVIVNQELEEVLPYASRLVLMDRGQITTVGCPAEVIDSAEEVLKVGVKLPDVAQIAYELRIKNKWIGPLPLAVSDALDQMRRLESPGIAAVETAATDKRAESLIEVHDASFSYPNGKRVIHNVSLTIRRGEFIALMGPNGAGKTTLAKHFNGLLVPTSGRVLIGGKDSRSTGVAQLASTVGYVFQNPDHQLFSRTIADEFAFGPKNLGWSKDRIANAVQRALEYLGGRQRGSDDPYFMGLAERKLIAIASVLIMEPEVLVLDEPATGADHEASLRIMDYLSALHRQGLTVVIVTHDVSLAANYADRVVVVREGSVALDGRPDEVFRKTTELQSCLVTPPQVARLAQALNPSAFTCRVGELVDQLAGA
ncbi:MAG: energy-coupling factor transporter ATPase [Terriglobales bacterium]